MVYYKLIHKSLLTHLYFYWQMSAINKVIAFDVETGGQFMDENQLLEVSGVVMDLDGNILDSLKVSLKITQPFEKRCMDEFWSKHKDVLDKIIANAIDASDAMLKFATWLDEMDEKHDKPIRLSDFSCFDIAWINLFLSKYTNRPCVYHAKDKMKNDYEMWHVIDTWSMYLGAHINITGLLELDDVKKKLGINSKRFENTHDSLEDASNIADNFNIFMNKYSGVKKMREIEKVEEKEVEKQNSEKVNE